MADVTGKNKVWVNHHDNGNFDTYALSLGSKDKDGDWINYSQEVRFNKELTPPQNSDYIEYKGFVTLRQWRDKDGKSHVSEVWQITEYKLLDRAEKQPTGSNFGSQGHTSGQGGGFSAMKDDDIPF